jgi:hypothetical protein
MKINTLELVDLVEEAKSKAFSGREILKCIKRKGRVITYDKLARYNNIDDALGKDGVLIILYLTEENFGHWVLLFRRSDKRNLLEFFDSYAMKPDQELQMIDTNFRKNHDELYPHLSYLLYISGYDIEYNHQKLQKYKEDVNTCGRWVAVRAAFKHLSLDQFLKLFKFFDPDFLVTAITLLI